MNPFTDPITVSHYLIAGAVLFVTGAICMATKRNALGVLMGIELVLNGANLNFVAMSSSWLQGGSPYSLGLDGHLMALFVIVLAAGASVPADCRILRSTDLFVDESTLTGESFPAEKDAAGSKYARELAKYAKQEGVPGLECARGWLERFAKAVERK